MKEHILAGFTKAIGAVKDLGDGTKSADAAKSKSDDAVKKTREVLEGLGKAK